jgi:hypothetical protein
MKPEKLITRKDLTRSFVACYRVEDEILAHLRAQGLHEQTPSIRMLPALNALTDTPPVWCEPEAWVKMLQVFARWCNTYGNLVRFQELRRTKEKAPPVTPVEIEA